MNYSLKFPGEILHYVTMLQEGNIQSLLSTFCGRVFSLEENLRDLLLSCSGLKRLQFPFWEIPLSVSFET